MTDELQQQVRRLMRQYGPSLIAEAIANDCAENAHAHAVLENHARERMWRRTEQLFVNAYLGSPSLLVRADKDN